MIDLIFFKKMISGSSELKELGQIKTINALNIDLIWFFPFIFNKMMELSASEYLQIIRY